MAHEQRDAAIAMAERASRLCPFGHSRLGVLLLDDVLNDEAKAFVVEDLLARDNISTVNVIPGFVRGDVSSPMTKRCGNLWAKFCPVGSRSGRGQHFELTLGVVAPESAD